MTRRGSGMTTKKVGNDGRGSGMTTKKVRNDGRGSGMTEDKENKGYDGGYDIY